MILIKNQDLTIYSVEILVNLHICHDILKLYVFNVLLKPTCFWKLFKEGRGLDNVMIIMLAFQIFTLSAHELLMLLTL